MGPIRGQTRPLPVTAEIVPEAQHIDVKLNASIHNRFDIEVVDSKTGEIKKKAQAENVILNRLWTVYSNNWNSYIQYGSGAGTPAATDTSLFTFIASVASAYKGSLFQNNIFSATTKIELLEAVAVGATLTEVGIARGTTADTLVTHAMIKDMNGNPISIVKTDTDIINIYATVFIHFYNAMPIQLARGYTMMRFVGLPGCYFPNKISISDNNTFATRDDQNFTIAGSTTFNSETKKLRFVASRMAADKGNCKGIYGLKINCYDGSSPFLLWLDTLKWYQGYNIVGEAIGTGDGTAVDFATTFPMVSNAKVYVNGVEDATATIIENCPFSSIGSWAYSVGILSNGEFIPNPNTASSTIAPDNSDPILYAKNRFYDKTRIDKILWTVYGYSNITDIYISDDLVNWVSVGQWMVQNGVTCSSTIPEEYKKYRYLKTVYNSSKGSSPAVNVRFETVNDKPIHFVTPPEIGAVITADYHTAVIAKDINHVFDFSLDIQIGEYAT